MVVVCTLVELAVVETRIELSSPHWDIDVVRSLPSILLPRHPIRSPGLGILRIN